jgi:hypothetical protein
VNTTWRARTFIGIERTDKAQHRLAREAERRRQRRVVLAGHGKIADIDGVRDHRHLVRGDAAFDDLGAQAFADRGGRVDAFQGPGFHRAREPVTQAPFAAGAVIDGRVFPEAADFIDDGNAETAAHAQRRDGVQGRRMGVQDIGPELDRQRKQLLAQAIDDGQLAQHRQARGQARMGARAVKAEAVDHFERRRRHALLGAGQLMGFPAERALAAQDGAGAEGVTAVQGKRMVEHMQDAQRRGDGTASGCHGRVHAASLRINASNISSVQIGAL